jgi:hypothetical protein
MDDEAEERDALGLAYTGRHYFSDAVEKTKEEVIVGPNEQDREMDEDELAWEMELIRRSGVKRSHQTIGNAPVGALGQNKSELKAHGRPKKQIEIPEIPDRLVQPWSEEELLRRLESDLHQLEAVSALHENRLANIESVKTEHLEFLKNAESSLSQASQDLTFFEEFKVYMINLIECVESKLTAIEELESQIFAARVKKTKKSQISVSNALHDGFILSDTLSSTPYNPSSPFQRYISSSNLTISNLNFSDSNFDFSDPHLDLTPGYASDPESTIDDLASYNSDLYSIADGARNIFEDTKADFCDLQLIFQRIGLCRQRYPISYKQAHLEDQLKDLISPIVKLEMLPWDPLQNPNLFDWPWFQITDQYILDGASSSSDISSSSNDPHSTQQNGKTTLTTFDQQLIPDIIAIVYCPKIVDAIKHFWRVNSLKESQNLQNLLTNAKLVLAPKHIAQIIQAIHASLTHAFSTINFPSCFNESRKEYPIVAFFRSLKFLSIAISWAPFFSPQAINSLIWEKMINGKIIPYLSVLLKAKEFSLLWAFMRYIIASIHPLYKEKKIEIKRTALDQGLETMLRKAEEESMAHFESFDLQQSVLTFWRDLSS